MKADHTHEYVRFGKKAKLFRCNIPGCTHVLHRELLINRNASCPKCGKVFIVTAEHLRRKVVHCLTCNKPEGILPDTERQLLDVLLVKRS